MSFYLVELQVNAKNRQTFQDSKVPADSPNFVKLPGSVVKDRNDSGKFSMPKLKTYRLDLHHKGQ